MNNFYSQSEDYVPCWITPLLQQALKDAPASVLTGAPGWGLAYFDYERLFIPERKMLYN
jgi:hypothetical protein